jgi:hypothetical protein
MTRTFSFLLNNYQLSYKHHAPDCAFYLLVVKGDFEGCLSSERRKKAHTHYK